MSLWKLQKDGTLIEAQVAVYAPKYTIRVGEKLAVLPDGWQEHATEADARKAFGMPAITLREAIDAEHIDVDEAALQRVINRVTAAAAATVAAVTEEETR